MRRVQVRPRLPAVLGVAGLGLLLGAPAGAGTELAPAPHQADVSHLVANSLSGYHYAARPLDDDLSQALLDTFLDDLDPNRIFFLKSDIAEFQRQATRLDDDLRNRRPSLDPAFRIFRRYTQRADEAYDMASRLAAETHTFDDAESSIELDRSESPWPKNDAEREALWRQRVRGLTLDQLLDGKTAEEATEKLVKRFARSKRNIEDLESPDVVEIFLTSLASVFDPHSAYYKPASSDDFDIRMRDALEGIGAELRMEDEYTKVNRLIPGGPAEAGGDLHAGDLILAVAQGDGEPVDVVDMRLDHVVKLIRGSKGSEVRLTVRPADAADTSATRVVSIIRDRVVLERASAKAELREVPQRSGPPLKVGVIEIPSFYVDSWAARRGDPDVRSTTNDTRKLIEDLRSQGADALLIDLRGNGGGALSEAISLTGLFIDEGPVVQIRDPNRGVDVYDDPIDGVAWAGPMVVLTDQLSASASEIFAGAIQDYKRGIVVGASQTHGKGTVQSMIDLGAVLKDSGSTASADKAGALKLTVQKFYRVSGGSTQNRGVVPDVPLPSPWDGIDVLESDLDRALAWDEVSAARYSSLPMDVDLAGLRSASAARVASEPVFGWLAEDVAERARREEERRISLNRETREREVAQIKARNEARMKTLGIEFGPACETQPDDCVVTVNGVAIGEDDEVPNLDDILGDAILDEALAVTSGFVAEWTPPATLVDADLGPRSADVGGKGRVERPRPIREGK